MNKFLRFLSTFVVGVGLILLFVYMGFQSSVDKADILNQPSYYTLQNYWYLAAAGCGCVAFSIVSCFLAWNRKLDETVEALPNAVAAEKNVLLGWLSGSSLDTSRGSGRKSKSSGKLSLRDVIREEEEGAKGIKLPFTSFRLPRKTEPESVFAYDSQEERQKTEYDNMAVSLSFRDHPARRPEGSWDTDEERTLYDDPMTAYDDDATVYDSDATVYDYGCDDDVTQMEPEATILQRNREGRAYE